MPTDDTAAGQCPITHRQGWCPFAAAYRRLGSTGFGMTLLVLIFLYSSVGSALPPVRQGVLADWLGWEALRFEMTEMEWFSTPLFVAMVCAFCLSILAATVRRIPLNLARLGEWVVHAGIVVMVIGCLIYFGRKIEGDAVIYQRSAIITTAGSTAPVRLVIRPEASVDVGTGDDRYRISVSRIMPRHEAFAGDTKGEPATAVWFDVQRVSRTQPARFTRLVIVGHPELTRDLASVGGGLGERPLDPGIRIDLDYEPQEAFFLDHTAAVYARLDPRGEWIEAPLPRLPRYAEHVSASADVWPPAEGPPPPPRPIDIEAVPCSKDAQALAGVRLRAVGFLPYARMDARWGPGGDRLNPVVRFSLTDGANRRTYELAAFDPVRNRVEFEESRFRIEFAWANSGEERERLTAPHKPRLEFRIAGRDTPVEMPLSALLDKGPQPVPGTDCTVTLASSAVMPGFPLMSEALRGKTDTVAIVRVERGGKRFQRLVFATFEDQSRDFDENHTPLPVLVDPDVRIRLLDPSPGAMRLIAGPTGDSCEAVIDNTDGSQVRHTLPVGGQAATTQRTLPIAVEAIIPRAVQETRPAIVPRSLRQPMQSVGAAMSLLAVEVDDGTNRQRVWLPFNQYVFPDAGYAYAERFQYGSYAPQTVALSDGRTLELLYSRQRRYLPAAVALERFVLETHPGGQRERDFISLVRFWDGRENRWSPIREVRSNHPAQFGGLWFYQAEWDPRNEALTVLGVGNREGIGTMLLGILLSIAGMTYSFYVKPQITRRTAGGNRIAMSEVAGPGPTGTGKRSRMGLTAIAAPLLVLLLSRDAARAESPSFAQQVDLSRIRLIAVQHDGRVKPFDTLAREIVQHITGGSVFDGQDPVFTYLDLMLNPTAYARRNLIYVGKARVREHLIRAAEGQLAEADTARIRRTRRVSPAVLALPAVQQAIEELERDMMTTARDANLLRSAQALADDGVLRSELRVIPVPGAAEKARWLSFDEAVGEGAAAAGLPVECRAELQAAWKNLQAAWPTGDAAAANRAMDRLADVLPRIEPRLYPPHARLSWEHWYYRHNKLLAAWVLYLAAFLCLLPAFLMRSGVARRVGMAAFVAALVLHTVSTGVRWYVARRFPTANMFEAVTAAAWSGAAIALILEVWLRRNPARNLFALGASFCGALALGCGYFMTNLLNSNISNPMPILNTVWLKIHVTLILISYVLIGVSFVTAMLYLVLRGVARVSGGRRTEPTGTETAASAAMADEIAAIIGQGPHDTANPAFRKALTWLSLIGCAVLAILLGGPILQSVKAVSAAETVGAAVGRATYVLLLTATVAIGPAFLIWLLAGTARIVFGRDDAVSSGPRAPLATVLDGSTMLLIRLAFVTLWIGIILGAAWADVSWGRPWGWDPKEVFALNTWLIFVGLIHVRLNVRDKGLWTAVLAVAGFVVMMFNWIGVNFFIVGLHSYA